MAAVIATTLSSVFGFLDQRRGEDIGVARRIGLRLGLLAGHHVELGNTVILVLGALCRAVALALLRDGMDQHRSVMRVADIFQDRQQMFQIVTVDRANIVEAELLKHGAAGPEATRIFFSACRFFEDRLGQVLGDVLGRVTQGSGRSGRKPVWQDKPTWHRPAARWTCRCRSG